MKNRCPNCGRYFKNEKAFFGFCCSDCYIGNLRGDSMKNFLNLINMIEQQYITSKGETK